MDGRKIGTAAARVRDILCVDGARGEGWMEFHKSQIRGLKFHEISFHEISFLDFCTSIVSYSHDVLT